MTNEEMRRRVQEAINSLQAISRASLRATDTVLIGQAVEAAKDVRAALASEPLAVVELDALHFFKSGHIQLAGNCDPVHFGSFSGFGMAGPSRYTPVTITITERHDA